MIDRVMVVGTPGAIGGAPVELWATIRLWVNRGLKVTCLPTSRLAAGWPEKIRAAGVDLLEPALDLPQLARRVAGPVAVAFCNASFVLAAPQIDKGVKLVWVGCMTDPFPFEERVYAERERPFDAYVCQSRCQMESLADFHRQVGAKHRYLIRGAFEVAEYFRPPQPRPADSVFTVGRISRSHPRKFRRDTWHRYNTVRRLVPCELKFRVLGWDREATRVQTGDPPTWVECLRQGAEPTRRFLSTCHVLFQEGEAEENWPRVGLEAMAAGVVVIAERRGGWCEMIEHGKTGFLARDAAQAAAYIDRLATNDAYRQVIAHAAQRRVRKLADPDKIWAGWKKVFEEIG